MGQTHVISRTKEDDVKITAKRTRGKKLVSPPLVAMRPVAPYIALYVSRGKLALAFLRFLHPPRDYRDFYVT